MQKSKKQIELIKTNLFGCCYNTLNLISTFNRQVFIPTGAVLRRGYRKRPFILGLFKGIVSLDWADL